MEEKILAADRTIFDLTEEQKSRHLEVNLPPTNFTFLRITSDSGRRGYSPFGSDYPEYS